MNKKPTTTDTHETVEHQIETLSSTNAALKLKLDQVSAERDSFQKQNIQLATVLDNQHKADLKVAITTRSAYADSDLMGLTYDQLKQIADTLDRVKDNTSYKPIRTGDSATDSRATVGNLFGKTRKEILDMGGDF